MYANDTLANALHLVSFGMELIPLYGIIELSPGRFGCTCKDQSCRCPGKHPMGALVPNGVKNATSCTSTIKHWFISSPTANIGIATGSIVVLHVDPRHGGDSSLTDLELSNGAMPHTWRVLTGGGGEHIYFKSSPNHQIGNSVGKIGPGLDIRGINGYVVAPPSRHLTGQRYAWSVDHHPDETYIADIPQWVENALIESTAKQRINCSENHNIIPEFVTEGSRNSKLTSIIGHLLRRYVDPILAFELVKAWNKTQCLPPLSDDELMKTVNSIAKLELQRREKARGSRP